MINDNYVDTNKVSIRLINKTLAEKLIVEHHYSHKWSSCRYAFGVYHELETKHNFFDLEINEEIIGVAIFGSPVGRRTADSISDNVDPKEVLELTRLWIADGYGKNIESYAISQCLKKIELLDRNISVIVSYADPEQGHDGIIYQATNWLYQGTDFGLMPNYSVRLEGTDEWIHSRTVNQRYGSTNLDHLKRVIGKTFYRKIEARKHRYLYLLGSKKRKKIIRNSLKHSLKDYPKNFLHEEYIEKIDV